MASFTRGTVLECAIEPCTNPAEIEVSIVGYGEYPPMVVRLCPPCANTFGKLLHDWPKPLPPPCLITTGISREELEKSLASHKDVITLSPPSTVLTHAQIEEAIAECDRVEQVCQDILKKEGYEGVTWRTHTYENGEVRTIAERDGKPLPERSPTRSPYVTVSHVKAGKNPYPLPSIEGEEYAPSFLTDAMTVAREHFIQALEEDIRRIEAHPASNAPEQHAPGWLPGDD